MKVIIDTSIILEDIRFEGSQMSSFESFIESHELEIIVPEVVVDELIAKYSERFDSAIEKVKKVDKYLIDNRIPVEIGSIPNKDDARKKFRDDIVFRLDQEWGADIVKYPQNTHKKIVDRLLQRKKPFKRSGDKEVGYRDYLIWLTVVKLHNTDKNEKIVFLSANTNDFMEKGRVHPDLKADLKMPENVKIYSNLESFIEEELKPISETSNALLNEIRTNQEVSIDWSNWILSNYRQTMEDEDLVALLLGVVGRQYSVICDVKRQEILEEPDFLRVGILKNGQLSISFRVKLLLDVEFDLSAIDMSDQKANDMLSSIGYDVVELVEDPIVSEIDQELELYFSVLTNKSRENIVDSYIYEGSGTSTSFSASLNDSIYWWREKNQEYLKRTGYYFS